jgi:hypothetical protein
LITTAPPVGPGPTIQQLLNFRGSVPGSFGISRPGSYLDALRRRLAPDALPLDPNLPMKPGTGELKPGTSQPPQGPISPSTGGGATTRFGVPHGALQGDLYSPWHGLDRRPQIGTGVGFTANQPHPNPWNDTPTNPYAGILGFENYSGGPVNTGHSLIISRPGATVTPGQVQPGVNGYPSIDRVQQISDAQQHLGGVGQRFNRGGQGQDIGYMSSLLKMLRRRLRERTGGR